MAVSRVKDNDYEVARIRVINGTATEQDFNIIKRWESYQRFKNQRHAELYKAVVGGFWNQVPSLNQKEKENKVADTIHMEVFADMKGSGVRVKVCEGDPQRHTGKATYHNFSEDAEASRFIKTYLTNRRKGIAEQEALAKEREKVIRKLSKLEGDRRTEARQVEETYIAGKKALEDALREIDKKPGKNIPF